MIQRINTGSKMSGLVWYLGGPGKHNEHENPRVISGHDGLDFNPGASIEDLGARRYLAEQLDGSKQMFRPTETDTVWHLSLSVKAGDRVLSDQDWAAISRDVMARMGFDDGQQAATPWAAVRHGTSVNGHDHVHVAVSTVRLDGSMASTWQDRVRMSAIASEIEQQWGLEVVAGRTAGAIPEPTRAEQEKAGRTGRAEPERVTLERNVRAAAAVAANESEFLAQLRDKGVQVNANVGAGRVRGYSVKLNGDDTIAFGGGKLAKDLTLPKLRASHDWEPAPLSEWKAIAEPGDGAYSTSSPRPVDRVQRPRASDQRTTAGWRAWPTPDDWRAANEQLRTATAGVIDGSIDHRELAGELAGVHAVIADEIEKPGGPLGQTERLLASTAQQTHQTPPTSKVLDGIAPLVMLAATSRQNDQHIAMLAFMRLLAQAAYEVANAHTQNQQSRTDAISERAHTINQHATQQLQTNRPSQPEPKPRTTNRPPTKPHRQNRSDLER